MSQGVSINEAAKQLNRTPSTVRRWVQKGCPCVSPGETGRGKGAILNLDDVITWRGGGGQVQKQSDDDRLQFIAGVLMDCWRRDKIHNRAGIEISQRQLAGILALIFERYYLNLVREPISRDTLPPEITQLCAIWVE